MLLLKCQKSSSVPVRRYNYRGYWPQRSLLELTDYVGEGARYVNSVHDHWHMRIHDSYSETSPSEAI